MNIQERISKLVNRKTNSPLKEIYNGTTEEQALQMFNNIFGLDDLKVNMYRSIISEESLNLLLVGPPATSKTLFMTTIQEKSNDVFYFDAANTTGAGLIEQLYQHRTTKKIIIDEIDKLKKNDQNVLLGLLNNQRVDKDLKSGSYHFEMPNLKVFATSNSLKNLSKPLRSRFQEYHLPEYTDSEFVSVVNFCLAEKFTAETSTLIAQALLKAGKKDARAAITISKQVLKNDTLEDIVKIIETYVKYASSEAVDYN